MFIEFNLKKLFVKLIILNSQEKSVGTLKNGSGSG